MKKLLPTIYDISTRLDILISQQQALAIIVTENITRAKEFSEALNTVHEAINIEVIVAENMLQLQKPTPKSTGSLNEIIDIVNNNYQQAEEAKKVIQNELGNIETKFIYSPKKALALKSVISSIDNILRELDNQAILQNELLALIVDKLREIQDLRPEIYNILQEAIEATNTIDLKNEDTFGYIKNELLYIETQSVKLSTPSVFIDLIAARLKSFAQNIESVVINYQNNNDLYQEEFEINTSGDSQGDNINGC